MKDYEKKYNELVKEMNKQEEINNKRMMLNMWILLITAFVFYLGIVGISCYAFEEGPILITIILIATVLFIGVCFYGLKLEVDAGYYECRNCHHRFKGEYFKALFAIHIHTIRYLECPKCHNRSWAKKVMTKE